MACVCSRRGGKFKKSDFGAPKKRERAAGDLERTKLVLRSLRAQVLLRRAYTSEPLVRNQMAANLPIPSPPAMSARGANPSEQVAVAE
jgi:hypothetical protein